MFLIDEKATPIIDGEKYFLRIRSNCIDGPVILFLHGGPGSADMPMVMKYQRPLAEHAVIVAWDQRGAGRAFNLKKSKSETLTKELYLCDVDNVVSYLKERFDKSKIIIVGHSFGSQLGVWYSQMKPENVAAFVGIGQVVDSALQEDISYEFTVKEAKRLNDFKALKKLNKIGPPVNGVYNDNKMFVQRKYLNKFGGVQYGKHGGMIGNVLKFIPAILKEYPLKTALNYLRANNYCLASPLAEVRVHFLEEAESLGVPTVQFFGSSDYNCPSVLAEKWFNALNAAVKKSFWIEKAGHDLQWEQAEEFNGIFIDEVLGDSVISFEANKRLNK